MIENRQKLSIRNAKNAETGKLFFLLFLIFSINTHTKSLQNKNKIKTLQIQQNVPISYKKSLLKTVVIRITSY